MVRNDIIYEYVDQTESESSFELAPFNYATIGGVLLIVLVIAALVLFLYKRRCSSDLQNDDLEAIFIENKDHENQDGSSKKVSSAAASTSFPGTVPRPQITSASPKRRYNFQMTSFLIIFWSMFCTILHPVFPKKNFQSTEPKIFRASFFCSDYEVS